MNNKILEFALDFEKRGAILYLDLAVEIKNSLSKRLFYTLAKQEIEHAERIDEFYLDKSSLKSSYKNMDTIEEEIKTFFEEIKDKALSSEKNQDYYEMAIKLEKEGYNTYKKFLQESNDENERKILEFLLSEEKNHLEAILNVYSYLTGTSDWLEQEESKTWNWMNI